MIPTTYTYNLGKQQLDFLLEIKQRTGVSVAQQLHYAVAQLVNAYETDPRTTTARLLMIEKRGPPPERIHPAINKDLAGLVSEFELDRRQQIYLRHRGDYWVLLRGRQEQVQLWSKEHHTWQTGDAAQDKYLFETAQEAWEYYKSEIRRLLPSEDLSDG